MMKKILLFALFIFISAHLYAERQDKPVRLAYSTIEAFPYQLGAGTKIANPPGIAVEIIQRAAKKLGLEIKLERLPNHRLFHHLRHQDIDGAFIFSYNSERETVARYPTKAGKVDESRAIAHLNYHLYQLDGQRNIWRGNQFIEKQVIVGILSGYSILYELQQLAVPFQQMGSREQLIKMLKLGRIDAIAAQDTTFDAFLKKHSVKGIVKRYPALTSKAYYVIFNQQFHRDNKQMVESFWREIARQNNNKVTNERH